jgi:hypothetical protein
VVPAAARLILDPCDLHSHHASHYVWLLGRRPSTPLHPSSPHVRSPSIPLGTRLAPAPVAPIALGD